MLNRQYIYLYETFIIIAGVLFLHFLEINKSLPVSDYLRIVVYAAISGHTIGGELLGFYGVSAVYDKYLHVFGAYAFALLGYVLLGMYRIALHPAVRFILVTAIGLSLGALYELVEFAMDHLTTLPLPAQSGLLDTNLDLLADLLGAILAALHLSLKGNYPLKKYL